MRAARINLAFAASSFTTMAASQSIYQIADIPFYSSLVPCAMTALSYAVNSLTNSKCPEGTAFQSCACTKQGNSAGAQASIISSAKYYCGATASEDFTSASLVFNEYCNQASGFSTPSPGNTQVSMPITNVPYFADLAPCAASAVSYAVGTMTHDLCQGGIPQLNYCACTKNENSYRVSSVIQSNVRYNCGATHSADVTSALALFAAWCKMADGTTEFPSTSNLGGSLSYYVTDLPDFSSMAKCAMNAVSNGVFTMTHYLCPEYPGALASCVCAKDGNSGYVSSLITSNIKHYCDSTATEDITSAMAVYDQYCKAAKGEVKPAGITVSVPEKTSTAGSGSRAPSPTAAPNANQPSKTSAPASTSTAADGSIVVIAGSTEPPTKKSHIGAIVGGIVGGVVVLAALAGFLWRRHRKNKAATLSSAALASASEEEKAAGTAGVFKNPNTHTSELHGEESAGVSDSPASAHSTPQPVRSELAGSPGPGVLRKPIGSASPVSSSELGGSPRPMGSELAGSGYAAPGNELGGSPRPYGSELAAGGYVAPGNELPGSGYAAPGNKLQGSGYNGERTNVHEASGNGGRQMFGGNNAGPVPEILEQGEWQQDGPHR